MKKILQNIVAQKEKEVAILKSSCPDLLKKLYTKVPPKKKSLYAALKNKRLSLIAEIKRKSPVKGTIADIDDPVSLAYEYVLGGANAISVLTDKEFFGGSLQDMTNVSKSLKDIHCPILRKDFIIDEYQIYESITSGADAVLLIVAVLGNKTKDFLEIARSLNLETLVEVHTKTELQVAINSGAEIIGINNRNLNNFQVDINTSLELVGAIPKYVIKVAESGINSQSIAEQLRNAGFDGILVGDALVRSKNPSQLVETLKV